MVSDLHTLPLHTMSMKSFIVSAFSTYIRQDQLVPCQHSVIRCHDEKDHNRVYATTSSPTEQSVIVNTAIPVSRISVCTGELCQCQGEQYEYTGGAAFAIIQELQSIGLPCSIDEVGCMVRALFHSLLPCLLTLVLTNFIFLFETIISPYRGHAVWVQWLQLTMKMVTQS